MAEVNVIGPYLVDLDGINLQFFKLKDFGLHKRIPILTKDDQYCAQVRVLSAKILAIFGLNKFIIFNIETMEIVETIKINDYI